LPDFSWYSIPKRENIPKNQLSIPKELNNLTNGHENTKRTQNLQNNSTPRPSKIKIGIFGLKICTYPIWQPWSTTYIAQEILYFFEGSNFG
jgi:hypothetical protein